MITATDLLEPSGDVVLDLFPGRTPDQLQALLTAYLTDGYARCPATLTDADKDRAATAWAYARVNRNVLARLSRTPASFTVDNEGSSTMLAEQIRTFKDAAVRWETDFDTITAATPTPDETPTSAAVNRYVW